jgi:hypothetical protein
MQRLVCVMHLYRLNAVTVRMELVYGYVVPDLLSFTFRKHEKF